MKVLDFYQFALLPAGTIFSYYEDNLCRGLHRKGGTITYPMRAGSPAIDFFESSIIAQCNNPGEGPKVDDMESRWGEYEYHQMFAVYEDEDLAVMIRMLMDRE